jgi:hypothetical protein
MQQQQQQQQELTNHHNSSKPSPPTSSSSATLTPNDILHPCIKPSECLAPYGLYTNSCVNAGCSNWICSLRLNCGCFAGQVTSCLALNLSANAKPGCWLLQDMFSDPESGCSWEAFLGPRSDPSNYSQYVQDCLAGCATGSWTSISTTLLLLFIIFNVFYL